MSRPLFLADHDVDDRILLGLQQKEPLINLVRARDAGLAAASDDQILEYAAGAGRIVISHDESTMTAAAFARIRAGQPMRGLLIAPQSKPIGLIIDELLVVWGASEADEWDHIVDFLPL
jgi:uncharacterized protein DUF5615